MSLKERRDDKIGGGSVEIVPQGNVYVLSDRLRQKLPSCP